MSAIMTIWFSVTIGIVIGLLPEEGIYTVEKVGEKNGNQAKWARIR